jgi:hypothetical protein
MTTHDTIELGLAFSVAAFAMPVDTTTLAGVLWVDETDWHARQPRLVAHELSQLAKRPIVVSRSFRFPSTAEAGGLPRLCDVLPATNDVIVR